MARKQKCETASFPQKQALIEANNGFFEADDRAKKTRAKSREHANIRTRNFWKKKFYQKQFKFL